MPAQQLQHEYFLKSSEMLSEGTRQAQEACAAYAGRVNELAGHARRKAQDLWQSYTQAARAAAVGDDASLRTMAAFQDFQREYAKLESEYIQSVGEAYSAAASTITAADSSLRLRMLDAFIAYLQGLRSTLASDASPKSPPDRG